MKACSGHMWSISPCLSLDEELHGHKQKCMPVLESTLQLDVSTPSQGLQQNIDWKKLSIEEAFTALIQSTTVPSIEDFIDILKKCKKEKNLGLSRHVTLHICNNGLDTHEELGNYLVPLFVACDSMPDAQQIFHRLVHCNEYSWTSLMDGYIDCGDAHHAFDVLQNMREDGVHPSRFTFLSLLRACTSLRCVEQCHRILMEIAKGGIERDLFIGSTLVDVYAKCGALTEAQGVFDKLPARDAVAWNTLIAGYAEHGYGEEALICLEQMQQEGVFPSVVTSVCSLKACGNIQFIDQGREIHGEIVIKGIERDPYICNTLVDMYGKCGSLVEAQEVLNKLLVRDVITWTALIAGYVEHGFPETAFNCLKQMQLEDVSPNSVTYVCILKACGSLGAIDMGKQIHSEIAKEGFERDFLVDNSLVDMYIKCGFLVEAYEMFDDMPFRDIVSWNTLIAGLSDHGFADEALSCLDKMQLMAVRPDAVTFVCILKACGSIGALDRGRELHSEIAEEGFESLPFVGNTLVDMYAKCNSLSECQEVFDELPVQDAVSWTALIAGYTENHFSKEALNCLEEMQVEGVPLNSATFVCSLKACSSLGAIDEGRELHAGVAREGFEGDPFVGNTLVYMYAKCGSWAEAQEVFDELPVQDVISWNLLMGGFVEHGLGKEAFVCFKKMQLEGVPMNALSFVWSLKACGCTGALDKAEEMHLEIVKVGLEGDSLIRNTLVDTFAKCGSLAKAREMFDELQVRDAVSWTALIAGYWESGLGMEALGFLEQMQQEGVCPDAVVLVCSLKVCGDLKAIDKGKAIHADITKHGFERESYVGNALVDMYAKCGFFADAWKVFDRFLACDVLSWNAIMSGYAEHELGEEVIQCLEEMQLDGVCPNAATFHSILKACGIIRGMERGKEMHLEIAKKGLERDPFVGNTLVDMYSKCGSPVDSRKALEELLVRDVISWTSLLAGYAEHGLGDDALTCLEQMALEGVSPNVVSWNAAIFGFAEQGESEKALVLYTQMQEQGLLPDTVTYIGILKACGNTASYKTGKKFHAQMHDATRVYEANTTVLVSALIDMYGKCGSMHDAQQVFDALPSRDLVRWTALMTGYARHGLSDIVFYSFQKMKDEGVLPNVVTFLSILTVCSHVGLVDEGRKYFEAMNKEYCIVPFIKHHNCMVDLLGRAGQLDEAEAILGKMPFQPDLVSWSTMLGACQKWGNVELGRQAFESAVRLDENCEAAFVSMLNIYADAQMWGDYKILEAMRINV